MSGKSRSMAHWSSEIVFLKLLPLGWGAAVRKDASAAWPPSTAGWDRPEKIVNSSRILLDDFEIGGELVVAARLLWKQVFGVQTQRRVDAYHAAGRRARSLPRRTPVASSGRAAAAPM